MTRVKEWISTLTNLGVLVGLAILIYEINQNTLAIENETDVAHYSIAASAGFLVADSLELAELLARAETTAWEDFSSAEQMRLDGIWGANLDNVELQFRLFRRRGEVPDNIVFGEQLFEWSSFLTYWAEVKHLYGNEFVIYFEELMHNEP